MHFNPETFKVAMQVLRNGAKGTAPITTGTTSAPMFHTLAISTLSSEQLLIFSNSFFVIFWSPGMTTVYINNEAFSSPDIKCFVIFLDFHFNVLNTNKRVLLSGANQNSRPGTYKNTNLTLKTIE